MKPNGLILVTTQIKIELIIHMSKFSLKFAPLQQGAFTNF